MFSNSDKFFVEFSRENPRYGSSTEREPKVAMKMQGLTVIFGLDFEGQPTHFQGHFGLTFYTTYSL